MHLLSYAFSIYLQNDVPKNLSHNCFWSITPWMTFSIAVRVLILTCLAYFLMYIDTLNHMLSCTKKLKLIFAKLRLFSALLSFHKWTTCMHIAACDIDNIQCCSKEFGHFPTIGRIAEINFLNGLLSISHLALVWPEICLLRHNLFLC